MRSSSQKPSLGYEITSLKWNTNEPSTSGTFYLLSGYQYSNLENCNVSLPWAAASLSTRELAFSLWVGHCGWYLHGTSLDFPMFSMFLLSGMSMTLCRKFPKTPRMRLEVAWDIVIRFQQQQKAISHNECPTPRTLARLDVCHQSVITPKNFFLHSVASHLYLTINKSQPSWSPRCMHWISA